MRRRRRARTPRTGRGACAPCGTTRRLQGGREVRGGENVRDEAGREMRARVVGAARACKTRGEDASRRSLDRDADPCRPYPRSARRRARRLRSRIGRWRDATTRSFDGVTEPRCATDSGWDRGNTYRRRPRRAKVAWLPPRTPSSSSRVSAMDRCVRVWRGGQRARRSRGWAELRLFFSFVKWVFHFDRAV
jgi:hypothetical protein